MAITHALAHTAPHHTMPPGELLAYVNDRLASRYTDNGTFVTAFYGVFDPEDRSFTYASAGHNPPRVKRCSDGSMFVLNQAQAVPLGIMKGVEYPEARAELIPHDQVILYHRRHHRGLQRQRRALRRRKTRRGARQLRHRRESAHPQRAFERRSVHSGQAGR
jgi:hypothetical protein